MRICDICKLQGRDIQEIEIDYVDYPESDRMNRKAMSKLKLEIHMKCLLKLLERSP